MVHYEEMHGIFYGNFSGFYFGSGMCGQKYRRREIHAAD
jgi:hypothetical protein